MRLVACLFVRGCLFLCLHFFCSCGIWRHFHWHWADFLCDVAAPRFAPSHPWPPLCGKRETFKMDVPGHLVTLPTIFNQWMSHEYWNMHMHEKATRCNWLKNYVGGVARLFYCSWHIATLQDINISRVNPSNPSPSSINHTHRPPPLPPTLVQF